MRQQDLFENPQTLVPVDPNLSKSEKARLSPKVWAVLAALRRRPHTVAELERVGGRRVAARVHDLTTKHGCVIESKHLGNGVWTYTLISESAKTRGQNFGE